MNPVASLTFERAYLHYLALLPAAGTLHLLMVVSPSVAWRLPVLVAGVSAVALYLAATISYLQVPRSALRRMLLLVNGPGLALLGQWLWSGSLLHWLTTTMLIDVGGIGLALLLVTAFHAPGARERRLGIIVTGLPLGMVLLAAAVYLNAMRLPWQNQLFLWLSMVQLGWFRRPCIVRDEVIRRDQTPLLAGIMGWVGAFILGSVLADG